MCVIEWGFQGCEVQRCVGCGANKLSPREDLLKGMMCMVCLQRNCCGLDEALASVLPIPPLSRSPWEASCVLHNGRGLGLRVLCGFHRITSYLSRKLSESRCESQLLRVVECCKYPAVGGRTVSSSACNRARSHAGAGRLLALLVWPVLCALLKGNVGSGSPGNTLQGKKKYL